MKRKAIWGSVGLLLFIWLYAAAAGQTLNVIPGEIPVVYYNQADSAWGSNYYDTRDEKSQTIASGGCGPTSLAMVYTSLTGVEKNPADMAVYAMENGYCAAPQGSFRSLFTTGATGLGLTTSYAGEDLTKALKYLEDGDLIVALMGKGIFCDGGHFVVIRGVTDEGNILIADCWNAENNTKEFTPAVIEQNLKKDGGGCLWVLGYEEEK